MRRTKKIFTSAAILFLAFLIYVSYDISTRTTFPGSKPQLKERIEEKYLEKDTLKPDSTGVNFSK